MPLLHKKPFEPVPEPTQLNPDDKVYYLAASNEMFTSYDDFFDRQIQLTSTIWSCEFTGKSGLTFHEAVDSEKAATEAIGSFPSCLEVPILYIVQNYTCRGRFDDLLNDIANVLKGRYFIGEECFLTENGKRKAVQVMACSVEDEQEKDDSTGLPVAQSYRYDVQVIDEDEESRLREGVLHSALSRSKQTVPKPKLKLFLKNACCISEGKYNLKGRHEEEGTVQGLTWEEVLGGPEPAFKQTPMLSRGRQSKVNGHDKEDQDDKKLCTPEPGGRRKSEKGRMMSEKKRQRIISQQEELATMFENAKKLNVDVTEYEQTEKFLSTSDIAALKETMKAARIEERDAQRELKRQKVKAKSEWGKKRDDLECDDLKPLPEFSPLPKPEWLSDEEFSDYLTILQFFNAYSDLLPTKEIRGTSRITLNDIIMGIRCPDPQRSPFADLMRVLLAARSDRADEEDGDEADLRNKDEITLITMQNCDPAHNIYGDDIKEASLLHKSIRTTHGESVRHLPVDWMTLTEILRLIFTTSGYYTGQNTHRHRLFARGYYRGYEDPGFVLAQEAPELIEKLRVGTVFDLTAKERYMVMDTIIRQLLSYNKFRSVQEEKLNTLWDQKRELRKLRLWDEQQEREAKDSRLAQEYEMDKLAEQGITTKPSPPEASDETKQLRNMLRAYRNQTRGGSSELLKEVLLAGVSYMELVHEDVVLARDLQRAEAKEVENTLQTTIFDMSTSFGPLHLGRDRAFRSYFLVESLPALLVENTSQKDNIGVCGEATVVGNTTLSVEDVLGCSGDMATCVVHGEESQKRPHWLHVDSAEKLTELLSSCNPRGLREIELTDELQYFRGRINEILAKVNTKVENGQFAGLFLHEEDDPVTMPQTLDWDIEMRELMLDLEEKMEQGQLGRLPVNREKWREMLYESGDVSSLITEDILTSGTEDDVICAVADIPSLTSVQRLALAFLQIAKAINPKFLKPPFVLVKLDDAGKPSVSQTFQNWQRNLLNSGSISNIALYLSTFEPSILWDKSRLRGKCRVCRRKGTAESLILCDDCDKCFHLECAHLKEMKPDWVCASCLGIRRKEAAAEKRRLAKEAKDSKEEEPSENGEYDDDADENSVLEGSIDSTHSGDVTRTSSGRAVKRVSTYRASPVAATPPLKTSRRQSSRTNGAIPHQSEEEDYDSDASARKSKRRRTGPKEEVTTPRVSGLRDNDPCHKEKMSKLEQTLRDAMKQEYAWPFLEPVNEKEVPDYYDIIKNPIDLQTMITKFKNIGYDHPEEVKEDMNLLVANCKQYNEDGSEIYECAEQIEVFFEDRLKQVFENKRRRV